MTQPVTEALADVQNSLHADLTRFVAASQPARRREAPVLLERYRAFRRALPAPADSAPVSIPVPVYAGTNDHVHRLMSALTPLEPWLEGAYVHGSTGTNEEVPYSDLDALVVLGDRTFESPHTLTDVASRLASLQRIMFEFDPLQHHGWFVLTGLDLAWYCDAYFPAELFRHARSVLPASGGVVTLRPRDSGREIRRAFTALAATTLRELESGRMPTDAYRLKGTLSRILLLPCLYLQARHGGGVFKKASFATAARDFPPGVWAVMDEISAIRSAWTFAPPAWQRFLLTRPGPARRRVARSLRTRVPPAIRSRLTPALWQAVARLVRAMQAAAEAPAGPV